MYVVILGIVCVSTHVSVCVCSDVLNINIWYACRLPGVVSMELKVTVLFV